MTTQAAEERNKLIRWLPSDYQAPAEVIAQMEIAEICDTEKIVTAPAEQKIRPKQPTYLLVSIRD